MTLGATWVSVCFQVLRVTKASSLSHLTESQISAVVMVSHSDDKRKVSSGGGSVGGDPR